MDTDSSRAGALLRERRLALGLTGLEVGRLVGVSDTYINRWEKGRTRPNTESLARLYTLGLVPLGVLTGVDADYSSYAARPTGATA